MLRGLSIIFAMFIVASCVKSEVTRYSNLPTSTSGMSFFMLPLESQKGSLEHQSFADMVAENLIEEGFVPANQYESADYIVTFIYGVGSGQTSVGSVPIYGQTGGGTTYQSGSVSAFGTGGSAHGTYSGSTYTTPTYGIVGSQVFSKTNYQRYFEINLWDREKSTPASPVAHYQAKVISKGSSSTFSSVAPCMIKALFDDFNSVGTSGAIGMKSVC